MNEPSKTPLTDAVVRPFIGNLSDIELLFEEADKLLDHARDLEIKLAEANARLDEALKAAGFCNRHQPDGGARNCLVCGCEQLTFALATISRLVESIDKDAMDSSMYELSYDEEALVALVAKKLSEANARIAELEKERSILRNGLNCIASWEEGQTVTSSFDEPFSAETAREYLSSADAAMKEGK